MSSNVCPQCAPRASATSFYCLYPNDTQQHLANELLLYWLPELNQAIIIYTSIQLSIQYCIYTLVKSLGSLTPSCIELHYNRRHQIISWNALRSLLVHKNLSGSAEYGTYGMALTIVAFNNSLIVILEYECRGWMLYNRKNKTFYYNHTFVISCVC